ncbi:MAG TPA: methyltransferase [Porphyromonadaceae bacterium]|nr:methyltransferase [Porphyromonadaceae bacterium]
MNTRCPICGNDTFHEEFCCRDHLVSGKTFPLIKCSDCGFLMTDHPPQGDALDAYYKSDDYISHSDTRKGIMAKLYHVVRNYMILKKTRWVERYSDHAPHTLLDVGCGTGYFAGAMKQKGWQTTAIEKNDTARNFAHDHFHIDTFPSLDTFAVHPERAHTFEVITLWHVLEHLEGLNEVMEQLRRLLTDDGRLFIAVPNSASFDASVYKADWSAYDVPRHLWHFAPAHLRMLAGRHRFEIIAVKRMPFDVFYISLMSERNAGCRLWFLRGFGVGLCGMIASLFDKKKCSSLLYVCCENH